MIVSTRHSRYHSRCVQPYFHQKFLLQSISGQKSLLICPAFLSYLYSLVEDNPDEAALRRFAIFSLDSFFQAHKTSTRQTKSRFANRSYRNEHVAYTPSHSLFTMFCTESSFLQLHLVFVTQFLQIIEDRS